jgi:hypothetical protein
MAQYGDSPSRLETTFALRALMEIPEQVGACTCCRCRSLPGLRASWQGVQANHSGCT